MSDYTSWNDRLRAVKFAVPYLNQVPLTHAYFAPFIAERLAKAYGVPGGPPIPPDDHISEQGISEWLAKVEHEDVRVRIVEHLLQGRYDLALNEFHNSYHHRPLRVTSRETASSADTSLDTWEALYKEWNCTYHGNALAALKEG